MNKISIRVVLYSFQVSKFNYPTLCISIVSSVENLVTIDYKRVILNSNPDKL